MERRRPALRTVSDANRLRAKCRLNCTFRENLSYPGSQAPTFRRRVFDALKHRESQHDKPIVLCHGEEFGLEYRLQAEKTD